MSARIRVNCDKANLSVIREFVKGCLKDHHVNENLSHQFVLAVDEACANCMIHQHQCDHSSSIEVNIYQEQDVLYAEIKDTGQAFPIDAYQPNGLNDLMHKRLKGGLGLRLIHSIMDVIKIEQEKEFFIYRLGKRVSPSSPGAEASH